MLNEFHFCSTPNTKLFPTLPTKSLPNTTRFCLKPRLTQNPMSGLTMRALHHEQKLVSYLGQISLDDKRRPLVLHKFADNPPLAHTQSNLQNATGFSWNPFIRNQKRPARQPSKLHCHSQNIALNLGGTLGRFTLFNTATYKSYCHTGPLGGRNNKVSQVKVQVEPW